ncbi:MAG: deoxyguanosinetriphosphate triphosphohydrolase [Anaerolineales bacterium]|nr:deoxyguanosinetriphosphate triphosphohydrolase [Anaerolineales bacterium]
MLRMREMLEERETTALAPYACTNRISRGRRYCEEKHRFRLDYQRDRDRIIHTTAFRRLEYKTQVFVYSEGDHYRNRLTHTIEVAQLGRNLARCLGCNEDLTEAICLVHDLGHPAFGHVGESTLNHLMEHRGGFGHQRQAFRIVTELERRYAEFPGLNLTYEVLEAILKHEDSWEATDAEGYHPEERASLESQLSFLADEIAYNTSDLDDGLRSGIIDPDDFLEVPAVHATLARLHLDTAELRSTKQRRHFIRQLIDLFVTDAIETTAAEIERTGIETLADLRSLPYDVAHFSEEMAINLRVLRRQLYQKFYFHYRVSRMAEKAKRILTDLFEAYTKNPRQLPGEVQSQIDPEESNLQRLICDYLAGMTDRYAIQEHRRLFDPEART